MPRQLPKRRSLSKYKAKRNFAKTPEPSGAGRARHTETPRGKDKKKPLRFCVQKHLASHLHYDFRLEHRGVLLSWAVPKGPSLNPAEKRLAMRVEDHPFDYRDFEGVIPEGYGAGVVMLWDEGTWQSEMPDVDDALKKGELKFSLQGVKLKGSWVLVRTRRDPSGREVWLLIKHRDEWAGKIDVIKVAAKSVKSFGDFADILAADKPDIWESHRPAKGGVAGTLLSKVIQQAESIRTKRRPLNKSKASSRSARSRQAID